MWVLDFSNIFSFRILFRLSHFELPPRPPPPSIRVGTAKTEPLEVEAPVSESMRNGIQRQVCYVADPFFTEMGEEERTVQRLLFVSAGTNSGTFSALGSLMKSFAARRNLPWQ